MLALLVLQPKRDTALELRADLYLWSNIAEPSLLVVETKIVVNTKFLKFQRRYIKGVQWLTPKRC